MSALRKDPAGHAGERGREHGFTIAELAFAFVIMVTATLALVSHVSSVYRRNATHQDRVYAYTKASSLLAELQSWVNRSEAAAANSLDSLDDGTSHNPVLTITQEDGKSVKPDHPLSGNQMGTDGWLWARRVTVRPFPGLNNRNVRYVTVKVFRNRGDANFELMADLSGVVNSLGSAFPPTQELDVYMIAIENVPGWWVHMDAIRPFVESTLTDLEARNPGAKIRTHWITKASYGRDPLYTPAINSAVDSRQDIPGVYMYPGKMPAGSASSYYYVPSMLQARMRVDGQLVNGYDATANPTPYALADNYNHAMRYEAERALFEQRLKSGQENAAEPTLRLLLEDMASDPDKYHNAVLVNLHGELLPMPALRNYSDAAKSPVNTSLHGLRVVTHGEQLRFRRGGTVSDTEDVKLRVYAYRTDPEATPDPLTGGRPISLQVMNADLTGNINGNTGATLRVERLQGGVDRGDGNATYRPLEPAPTSKSLPNEMYFTAEWVDETTSGGEKFTWIRLYNTPSIAPVVGDEPDDHGLYTARRLYGMEYVPCSTETANDFSVDLAASGAAYKNTARWRITIPKTVLSDSSGSGLQLEDHALEVRTRIGEDLATGRVYPALYDPANLSRTWVYWTDSAEDVPHTERYQFIGDPRHCPYADLKDGGVNFPNGYNWFFDNFKHGSIDARPLWDGFSPQRLRDNWQGRIEIDWARYAQLLRHAVTRSEAVFTTLTGFSYYYIGIGGEIGYDAANGYPSSIPVNLAPYGRTGWGWVDSIAAGGDLNYRFQKIVRSSGTDYWWGMHWLGELYPDSSWTVWSTTGNLPAGSGAGQFYRVARLLIDRNLPLGTRLAVSNRSTRPEGCTSVFNIGETNATFHHQFQVNGKGSLEGAGLELASNYNFPMPTTTKISRPFGLALSYHGGVGDEWWFPQDYPRFTAAVEKTYYRHETGLEGSALVGLTTPDGARTAHVVVNGLDTTIESGTSFIAKYAVLSLIHSFFEAGHPSITNRITLPPRVELTGPTEITELNDPADITITWSLSWRRWDGRKYSESFGDGFALDEGNIKYVLMYSTDGGKTFKYVQDGTPATPGERPANPSYMLADTGDGDETHLWPTPSGTFPEGSYVLRVEAYRNNERLHYSYHQSKIYIER